MHTAPATAVPAPYAAVSFARRRPWRLQVLHLFQHGDRLPHLASVVLCLFAWCLVSPALLAAQTVAPRPTASSARPASAEAEFSTALAQIEAKLVRLRDKLAKAESTRVEDADLQHWRQRVEQLDARARQTFDQLAQHLRETGMLPEMLQRHQAMVTAYAAEVATLRQHLMALAAPGAPAGRTDKAARALQHLQALQPAPATPPVAPTQLPFRIPDDTVRKPRETTKEFESFRVPPHATMLAAADLVPGLLAAPFAPLPATPTPDDLAPTEDVQFTAEIRALATSLGANPVAIFNWVHDHIAFLPTYGAMQGAHLTWQTRRGNAFDTASLLIALLRAARIPARYVYGTVQMPIDQVMPWVGGVTTPEAALQVLGQGGIPHVGVVQGGVITAVKLEHMWVEAWVDFFPSQGAKHVQGDTWIPLDASFKPSQATAGQAPQTLVREVVPPVAAAVLEPARLSAEGALVTGFDLGPLTPLWQDTLQRLLGAYAPATPLGAVLGQRTIVPSGRPVLAAGLPYTLIVRGGTQRALLPAQRHHVRLTLFPTPLSGAGASAALTYSLSLPALQTQRLGVTYEPATPADAALLDSLQAQGATVLPVYLLQARPLLQLDGVTVASGPPLPLGQRVEWQVHLPGPQDPMPAPVTFRGVVGDEQVFALNGSGMVPATVRARLAQQGPRTPAEDLHLTALQHWLASDVLTTLTAQFQGTHVTRLPSIALVTQPLTVTTLLGLPYTGTYQSYALDVGRSLLAVAAPDASTRRAVLLQSGLQGSYLAGAIFDSVLSRPQGTSRSAVSLLALAHQQGLPLALLIADTVATLLPQLQVRPDLATALRNAVAAGYHVLVPAQPPQHGAETALGYVVLDPLTGAGAYVLASGVRGGEQRACQVHLRPATAAALSSALATRLADFALPATAVLDASTVVGLTTALGLTTLVPALATALDSRPALLGDLAALLAVGHLWPHTLVALDVVAAASAADCVTDTTPPVVALSGVPSSTAVGRAVLFTVTATDESRVATLTLRVNDTPQPLDAAGRALYTPPAVGTYTVVAVAQDSAGNTGQAQATFVAVDASQDTTPPIVDLSPPTIDAPVTAPTIIRGLVQDDTLVRWTLALAPRGEERFTTLATGTTVPLDGVFGLLDPTLLLNDLYELRLTAEDANGRLTTITIVVQVSGGLKIGHLSFTLEDLSLPMVGLPITINRTYDSRDTAVGDFGVGWRLDIQTLRLRTGRPLGTDWAQGSTGVTFPVSYCLERDPMRIVALTLPDGHQEVFDFTPTTAASSRNSDFGKLPAWCQWLVPIEFATAAYTPRPGTLGTLEALADPELWIVGGTGESILILSFDLLDVYAPRRWRYTTPEGLKIEIEQGVGVQKLTEPNGHTLTFGRDGILHSAGPSVHFTRDAQGRITQITDPMGHTLTYAYDTAGDLVAVTDQEGHTTRYQYDATHKLVAISDPRGVTVARNLYDNAGRLIAHVDAEGHRIEYTHDIAGRREIVTDRLGHPTLFIYDEQGNILRQTDPLGQTTTSTYDARGNVLTTTNPLGHTTTLTYDTQNNLLTQTEPLGHTTAYTYGRRNKILTITDPLGHITTNTYDTAGQLLTTADALGQRIGYTYNADRGLERITDSWGHTTLLTHDNAAHLRRIRDAMGQETLLTYDANRNLLTASRQQTDALGNVVAMVTTHQYDRANRLVHTTDAFGNSFRTVYGPDGAVAATIDADHTTTYTYDALGRLITTTFPDGTTEAMSYDANGNLQSVTDRVGKTTRYTYDAVNRRLRTIFPDGSSTATEYDAAGREIASTDARGHRTTLTYDRANRLTQLTDALGQTTVFTYDANGHHRARTTARGDTTEFTVDARGRRTQTRFPDGTTTLMEYDARGHLIAETDQAGQTRHFAYDGGGHLAHVTDTLGHSTTWTYDPFGNVLTQTDANGHTTRWTYDRGRRITRTLPLGMTEHMVYDTHGRLVAHTDFNGQTTSFTYDAEDQLLQTSFPDGTSLVYTYTATGQRATVTDGRGTTHYQYDGRDRLRTVLSPDGTSLSYTYDGEGNRTMLTTPGGITEYTYDALNRLRSVQAPFGGVTTSTYDAVGNRLSTTRPNGVTTAATYDRLQRLTALEHRDPTGSLLARYAYTLGATGRRLRVQETPANRTVVYTYDALGRLVAEASTDATLSLSTHAYTYDAVGNRLTATDGTGTTPSTYDANDRLLTAGSVLYTFDANGSMITQRDGVASTTYHYDAMNRLRSVHAPGSVSTYEYDADGNRVRKTVNGVVTDYLIDTNQALAQVVAARDAQGVFRTRYVYGDGLLRGYPETFFALLQRDQAASLR